MDKTEPTEQETQGTPIVTEEVSDWGNTARIVEPGQEVEEVPEEESEEVVEVEDEEVPDEEEYEAPTQSTSEDPGQFVPKDYSFEVTVYDDEGKNGKTVKIKSIDEWEDLLDKDPNFGKPSALLKANRLATNMESKSERDKTEWQEKMDAYQERVQFDQEQQEQVNTIASEINYLVEKGELPAVDKKYANANWSDPEIAKQPGIKEQVELLEYMRKENVTRKKAGLAPMRSALDAFNAMQLDLSRKKKIEAKKQAGEARKQAGSRVAGTTPAPVSNAPKGIAVGRGGSLKDLTAGW